MKKNPVEKKILEKTSKQIRKEKRSGLFKKEQVRFIEFLSDQTEDLAS